MCIGPVYSRERKSNSQSPATAAKTEAGQAQVDLNTAREAELDKLPGVGPATAKKIIAGRPYTSVSDLARAGVPAKTIQKLTPLVTVSGNIAAAISAPGASARNGTNSSTPVGAASSAGQNPPVKGMVWVNTETRVYHREGDPWYSKTKHGKFMVESEVVKAGFRASKEGPKK
jgi:hypothetical protein